MSRSARAIAFAIILTSSIVAMGASMDLDRFRLAPPLVTFVEENARWLVAGDFDGDDKSDFAVFDTQKNLLRVFYRRDNDAEPFEKQTFVVEQVLNGMSVGDLNGDERDDLLFSASPPTVLYQTEEGRFAPAEELDIEADAARIQDVDGDGRDDITAVKGNEIRILLQDDKGALGEATTYRSVVRLGGPPKACDVDGDARFDLIYPDPSNPSNAYARLQDDNGGFGFERVLRLGEGRAAVSSKLGPDAPGVALTDGQTGVLKVTRMRPKPATAAPLLGSPRLCAFDIEAPSGRESVIAGDLDGSGTPEIAVLSPSSAKALIYAIDSKGALSRRSAPTLSGVTQAHVLEDKRGRGRLWMLSPDEEAIGVMAGEGDKREVRFGFPRLLGFDVKPMAFAVANVGRKDKPDLIVGYQPESEEGDADLELAISYDLDESATRVDRVTTLSLPGSNGSEIVSLLAEDLNGDEKTDLICFFDYQPLRILIADGKGGFKAIEAEQSVGAGTFNEVTPARLRLADVNDDGRREILIARSSFARALSIDKDGVLKVVDQFNARNARGAISAAVMARLDGDEPFIVLLDTGNNCLTIYGRDDSGAWSLLRNEDIKDIKPREMLARDLNDDGSDDLALIAADRLGVVFGGVADDEMKMVGNYITDLENGRYATVKMGDFDGDGGDEIVALEYTDHVLDLFRVSDEIDRFYRFKVFEGVARSSYYAERGILEPRELVLTDFNGDERLDILALCHREVLVYCAEEREAEEEQPAKKAKKKR